MPSHTNYENSNNISSQKTKMSTISNITTLLPYFQDNIPVSNKSGLILHCKYQKKIDLNMTPKIRSISIQKTNKT